MKTVTSEDVSALLDGALTPDRAAEVRAAIKGDPLLHAEFEMLERLDSDLTLMADEMAFMPQITLPAPKTAPALQWGIGLIIVAALLILRFWPKFANLALIGVALQIVAAAAILVAIVAMTRDNPSMRFMEERA